MPNFMLAYYGGEKPNSKEESMAHMAKWQEWIKNLGDTIVNAGTPLMNTKVVTTQAVQDDNDTISMNGFAVITAKDMDAALNIATQDPFLDTKGTLRVSQMMEIM